MWKANKRWLKCSPGLGEIPCFTFFFFMSFQLPWAHLFDKHYWTLTLQTLGWVLWRVYWWMRYDICLEEITSKSMKLFIFLEEVLLISEPGFLLFSVFHPAYVISFSFVPLLYLEHISINNHSHIIVHLFDYVLCPRELWKPDGHAILIFLFTMWIHNSHIPIFTMTRI